MLDLDAGLRDAQLPEQRGTLHEALDEVLDAGAGLEVILPPSRGGVARRAVDLYTDRLIASSWQTRLATRATIPYAKLSGLRSVVLAHIRISALRIAIDRARHLSPPSPLTR